MNEQGKIINDIDYEHMDDLPLSDHIEWNHLQTKKMITEDLDYDQFEMLPG